MAFDPDDWRDRLDDIADALGGATNLDDYSAAELYGAMLRGDAEPSALRSVSDDVIEHEYMARNAAHRNRLAARDSEDADAESNTDADPDESDAEGST